MVSDGTHKGRADDCSGMKRLDTGALVKEYETQEREIIQPYQLAVSNVAFEDERFLVSGDRMT